MQAAQRDAMGSEGEDTITRSAPRRSTDRLPVTALGPPPLPAPNADYDPGERLKLIRALSMAERQVELAQLAVDRAAAAVSSSAIATREARELVNRLLLALDGVESRIEATTLSPELFDQHAELGRRYAAALRELEQRKDAELVHRGELEDRQRKLYFLSTRAADARRKLERVRG
jgi:hypothetical protein